MLDEATRFHHQAELAREQKSYGEALRLYAEALFHFGMMGNTVKVSEIHAAKSIAYRHLFNQAADAQMQAIWKEEIEAHVHLALKVAHLAADQGNQTGFAMAFFNAAKFYEIENNAQRAIECFAQALHWIQQAPPTDHDRPAVVWDFKLKLALASFLHGDAQAMDDILVAIAALSADTGVDADYNAKVWISGAYLRLATHFESGNLEQARDFLAKAKHIIDQDERLVVRREEYQKIAHRLQ